MTNRTNLVSVVPLFFVLIIETMSFGIIFPVLGPMFLQTHATIVPPETTIFMRQLLYGVTLSIFSLMMLFGAPVLGDLSDRCGRKNVVMIALAGSALGMLLDAFAIEIASLPILIIGRVIGGFFAGSQTIAQAAIADVSTQENKAINMSLIIFANCIGFVIGPVFGGYFSSDQIIAGSNYATPFYVAGILAVLNLILVMVLFKETFQRDNYKKLQWFRGLAIFKEAFENKQIQLLSIITLLSELGWALFFLYLTIFLVKQYHYSSVVIGHYMSFYGLVWAVTLIGIVRVIVHYLRVETIVWSSMLIYGVLIFLMLIPSERLLWAVVVPIGVTSGLSYAGLITVFSNSADEVSQGWVMGISTSVLSLAWGVGGVLAGVIGSINDYYVFVFGGVLTIIAGIIMLKFSLTNK